MNTMATWMQSWTMDGKLAILLFPVIAGLLLFASLRMVKWSEVIIAKSKFGGGFIGATLIATVTSIPELVTEISQGVAGHPENGMGDDIGSNAFSIFLVGVAGVLMFKYMFLNKLGKWTKTSIMLSLGMTIVLSVFLMLIKMGVLPLDIQGPVGLIPLGFFIFFLFTIFLTYKYDDSEEEIDPKFVKSHTLKQGVWMFILAATFVALFAILVNVNVNAFSGNVELEAHDGQYISAASGFKGVDTTGWSAAQIVDMQHQIDLHKALKISSDSAGGVFLAITTSLPEVVAFFAFLRKQQPAAAIASLVGSHFFNIGIAFFGDLAYHRSATFNKAELGEHAPLAIMTVGMLILIIGHFILAKKLPKYYQKKAVYFAAPILMIIGYVIGWAMILMFNH